LKMLAEAFETNSQIESTVNSDSLAAHEPEPVVVEETRARVQGPSEPAVTRTTGAVTAAAAREKASSWQVWATISGMGGLVVLLALAVRRRRVAAFATGNKRAAIGYGNGYPGESDHPKQVGRASSRRTRGQSYLHTWIQGPLRLPVVQSASTDGEYPTSEHSNPTTHSVESLSCIPSLPKSSRSGEWATGDERDAPGLL
jgi:hypothetical protein